MTTQLGTRVLDILALTALAFSAVAAAGPSPPGDRKDEVLESPAGVRTTGRFEGDAEQGFRFVAAGTNQASPLEPGAVVVFPGRGPSAASGLPPFSVEMGLGQRISGRLASITDRDVQLLDLNGEGRVTVARGGALSVAQRPGESLVFQDGFETIDEGRWVVNGEPDVVAEPKVSGARALSLPAGGSSLTHKLERPFGSGRLELAYHDNRAVVPEQQWFVDLTFRGKSGPQTVRVVLGWVEESLAVESSPGSPALAVQRLARQTGWHRLAVRFGADLSEVGVDGNELAHGKGFGGPLAEVRLASFQAGKNEPPADLAGQIDDLRLVRFDDQAVDVETDVNQDEIRLTGGDQLFGKVRGAGVDTVEATVDRRDLSLPWGEVSGLYFRRDAAQGAPVEGLLVRADWRAGPGPDPRDLNTVEGALTGLSGSDLTVATPYAGTLVIPRSRMTKLRVIGRGRRVVLDPMAHHLGDEISAMEPILDPPEPEGGVLERTALLADLPAGPAFLVLDVVQVVGESAEVPFSTLVKKGELRTNVKINGEPFDYLNRHITSKNETPERVRLPIPRGLLKPGKNVIRFEQAGIASDPKYLDDLGVLSIALEFAAGAPRVDRMTGHRMAIETLTDDRDSWSRGSVIGRRPDGPDAPEIDDTRRTRPEECSVVKTLTRSMVRHAHAIAREVGARVVLLYADVVEDDKDLNDLIQDVDFRVILISRRVGFQAPGGWGDLCAIVRVPDIVMTRAGQIKVATLVAAAESLIRIGDRIVCLTGIDGSGTLDTVMVLDMGTEIEMFADTAADPLPADVAPAVFERLLTLAGELGTEGREGRPVGTLFVVGDSDNVISQSHQLVINPFQGYPETERNILNPRLEETIKEFSAIDGAFIIRGDGVVLNCGRYLAPRGKLEVPLPHGLGTRHEAAAVTTVTTDAIALCISQSTGTISIFRRGRMLTDIQKPRSGLSHGL